MKYITTQIACLFLAEIIYLTSAQCQKCDQTITGRNFMYSRALDIIQNEEYLDQSDFDEIRLKRIRRQTDTVTNGMSYMSSVNLFLKEHFCIS